MAAIRTNNVVEIVAKGSAWFHKEVFQGVESKDVQTDSAPEPKADSGLAQNPLFSVASVSRRYGRLVERC
jgi:hypothetical protein